MLPNRSKNKTLKHRRNLRVNLLSRQAGSSLEEAMQPTNRSQVDHADALVADKCRIDARRRGAGGTGEQRRHGRCC